MPNVALMILIFSIPIIAVAGGITMAILRMASQHRLLELAQRERIAMIEKGLDPSKLPPPEIGGGWAGDSILSSSPRAFAEISRRRAQSMMIGGIVLLFLGVGLGIFLYFIAGDEGGRPGLVGLIPGSLGLGLIVGSRIVAADAERHRNGNGTTTAPQR